MIEWTSTSCPLQEVLLHHSTEGPRVSIPQWMEARATRGHMENLPAHVRWTDPHTGGAALLLRGLRLVRLHPAAVHGLSLQPGQQQTGQSNRSLCHTDVTVTDSEMFNTLLNCFKNENIQMWELTFELLQWHKSNWTEGALEIQSDLRGRFTALKHTNILHSGSVSLGGFSKRIPHCPLLSVPKSCLS